MEKVEKVVVVEEEEEEEGWKKWRRWWWRRRRTRKRRRRKRRWRRLDWYSHPEDFPSSHFFFCLFLFLPLLSASLVFYQLTH